jgi:hypothetical protein
MSIAEPPKQRHLLHLFYQVQIRLGSPPALLAVFAVICSQIAAIASPRPVTAPRMGTFPKLMRREHYGNFSVADSAARATRGRDRELCCWSRVAE